MERVDSDRTDESPFGSTLTTPVDEDVILFHGIEQRLIGKSHISHDEVEEGFTMIPNEGGGDVLSKAVNQDYTKSMEDTTVPSALTSLTTLERPSVVVDAQLPTSDAVKRRATRPRSQSIYATIQKPLEQVNSRVPTDIPSHSSASGVDLSTTLRTAERISQRTGKTAFEAETMPEKAALSDEKLISRLNPENGKMNQDAAEAAKDLLALLPFAHQSPTLDVARATDYFSSLEQLSLGSLGLYALRGLFFLPWCVIAGATILLFPRYLEIIIFGPGIVHSPQGIHRFAFWTEVSKELVSTFLASLIIFWCLYPTIGYLLMGFTVARFLYAWKGFKPNRKIRVGEDDMQSLYYVLKHYTFGDDTLISLREDEVYDGFYF